VLDDDDRVAAVDELLERPDEPRDVGGVEPGRRLVEYVERSPAGALRELADELDPLSFATTEVRRRLSELEVAEPERVEELERSRQPRHGRERLERLADREREDVGDRAAAPARLERRRVEARAAAALARDLDRRQERHLDPDPALAVALGATAPTSR